MPVIIKCKSCGEVFYVGYALVDLKKFLLSLERCRSCGRKLDMERDVKIIVKSIDEE